MKLFEREVVQFTTKTSYNKSDPTTIGDTGIVAHLDNGEKVVVGEFWRQCVSDQMLGPRLNDATVLAETVIGLLNLTIASAKARDQGGSLTLPDLNTVAVVNPAES